MRNHWPFFVLANSFEGHFVVIFNAFDAANDHGDGDVLHHLSIGFSVEVITRRIHLSSS